MKATPALAILLLSSAAAQAVECPPGMAACKIVILSPQEEQILVQPNGILPTAAEARKVDFAGAVQYFLQKIKDAPAGEAAKPPEPKPADAKPATPETKH